MPWIAGIPRDAVDWGPTIDPEKCVSCGMCMNCGKKVFDWVDGKPATAGSPPFPIRRFDSL